MNLRPIFYIVGILISMLSASMAIPMLIDIYREHEDWKVFFLCMCMGGFFGGALVLSNSGEIIKLTRRQAFLLTTLSWVTLAFIAALPFNLSELDLSFTDSVFEAISGLTTTGSTVMSGLDYAPPGILIWRALLQWLGGIGIIIMALTLLPFMNVGGMQIFKTDVGTNQEKALPRTAQISLSIALIYLAITLMCTGAYIFCGMSKFDALAHAMTTISTGGFSTSDNSIGYFESHLVQWVAIVFMILGGIPFVLYLKALRGNIWVLLKDSQVKLFIIMIIVSAVLIAGYLVLKHDTNPGYALSAATFNTVSMMTGTGYTSENYDLWGSFSTSLLFFLMMTGACAGSTTCGIKLFRLQVFVSIIRIQIKKLIHPHGVMIPRYNNKPLPNHIPLSVLSFLFLYSLCFSAVALALSATGLDAMTSLSGAATSIANVGPGMGSTIGPQSNFASIPDAAKWVLCISMLLGRLEIMAPLVLLNPFFWKN